MKDMRVVTRARRKKNFSDMELKVLIGEVKRFENVFMEQGPAFATRRKRAWNIVTHKINAVGVTRRTTEEVKKKVRGIRRMVKDKKISAVLGERAFEDLPTVLLPAHLQTRCPLQQITTLKTELKYEEHTVLSDPSSVPGVKLEGEFTAILVFVFTRCAISWSWKHTCTF